MSSTGAKLNQPPEPQGADAALFAGFDGVKACVDVGGTKIAVSVADRRGLHGRVVEPTVREGAPDGEDGASLPLGATEDGGIPSNGNAEEFVVELGGFLLLLSSIRFTPQMIPTAIAAEQTTTRTTMMIQSVRLLSRELDSAS